MVTIARAARLLMIAIVVVATALPAEATPLPRYRFVPGQRLVYEGHESMTTGRSMMGVERETTLSVVRRNPDASWRLIVAVLHRRFSGAGPERRVIHRRHDFHVVDLTADGRLRQRGRDHFDGLDRFTPRLPADAEEAERGWTFRSADILHRGRLAGADGTIEIEPSSPMNELNGFSSTLRYTLDPHDGVITEISTQYRHKGRETRTAHDRLVERARIDPAELAIIAREIDAFTGAADRYETTIEHTLVRGVLPAAATSIDTALASFEEATDAIESATLRARRDEIIAAHRATRPARIDRLQRQSAAIGVAAPTFSLPDLDGEPRDLATYRGQVVVLDFWYRACGWCVRAMPQIQALHERFAGRPVAVLGVNVDRERDDARLVVERLGLTYPSVQADGTLAAAYGVRSYPTLAVIDRAGVLRGLHVGYASTLEADLSAFIEELLAEP